MSADQNERQRERYRTSAEVREKRRETNRKYYLSHKQNWKLYEKNRRKRVHDRIKEQCGGMKL